MYGLFFLLLIHLLNHENKTASSRPLLQGLTNIGSDQHDLGNVCAPWGLPLLACECEISIQRLPFAVRCAWC